MKRTITVTLTRREAETLLQVAGNGYDDGHFYQDADGSDTGRGGWQASGCCWSAMNKLRLKLLEGVR